MTISENDNQLKIQGFILTSTKTNLIVLPFHLEHQFFIFTYSCFLNNFFAAHGCMDRGVETKATTSITFFQIYFLLGP
jgi:hypothetical protein